MPDAHVGYGLPIGGVLATDNPVIPYAVGVDIACRMKLTVYDRKANTLAGQRDRFANTQPDLSAWLDQVDLPESGGVAATDLVFEAWAMLDHGFGDRLGAVAWKDVKAVESEPPPLESEEPAFAAYAAEQLDNLADDDPEFGPQERAQVERVLAAAAAALRRAVAPEPAADPDEVEPS
jgi:hypothetical protein